jgi:hypothetical protein
MNKATPRKSGVVTLMASISRITGLTLLFGAALTLPLAVLGSEFVSAYGNCAGKVF